MARPQEGPIHAFFEPRVASAVGAFRNPGKIRCAVLNGILSGGCRGRVYPLNAGGAGAGARDACEKYGVPRYDDLPALQTVFGPPAPEIGSTKKPIDIPGEAGAGDYPRALNAALDCDGIHAVLGVYCHSAGSTARGPDEAGDVRIVLAPDAPEAAGIPASPLHEI